MARAPAGAHEIPCDIIKPVTATYLYCIVQAAQKPNVTKAPAGLPQATPPDALDVAPSLWIIAADVPMEVYAGEHLEKALADLTWVGETALAHEAVVEHFSKQPALTVIPLKLFTMFSSRAKAVADVRRRRTSVERTMKKLAGAEEWGIRILRAEVADAVSQPAVRVTSGAAFLTAKKHARDTARAARIAAAEAAAHVFDRLSRIARDSQRRTDAPANVATPPLLDAAFLVPVAKRAAFENAARREAETCRRAGAEMILTGPWPAYHFASAS